MPLFTFPLPPSNYIGSMGRSSVQVLGPNSKVTRTCTRTFCPAPTPALESQSIRVPPGAPPPHASSALLSLTSRALQETTPAPASLTKLPSMHSLHRGCFYKRPLFQDWVRQLFCLIHRNKHRKWQGAGGGREKERERENRGICFKSRKNNKNRKNANETKINN